MDDLFYPVKLDVLKILPLIDTHAKDLYLCLCAHADFETGRCWPSYRRILTMTKMTSPRVVKRAIDHLVELALIDTWMDGQKRVYRVMRGLIAEPPPCCINVSKEVRDELERWCKKEGEYLNMLSKPNHINTLA